MFCGVMSAEIAGVEAVPVRVEADLSDGLPFFAVVGYVSSQVKEAQDRVKTALKNQGLVLPPKRMIINLAPGDIRKEGTRFDLPIAAAILAALGKIPAEPLSRMMVLGELHLDGGVGGVRGILPSVRKARELGLEVCVVPAENYREGSLVEGIQVVGVRDAGEFLRYCREGRAQGPPALGKEETEPGYEVDFSDLQGQDAVKRAVLIAAAGFHNLLMEGPPGAGKSMAARRIPTILPELTREESLELTQIYSVAGLLPAGDPLIRRRPFRAPHHTLSPQALCGGGRLPVPGEISLAHRGVLFLDELPEVSRRTLELLRQPMEEKQIVLSRTAGTFRFPADFMLVGAMNPCPCGCYPDLRRCTCTPADIYRYRKRISQPLLDRIDLAVQVPPLKYEELRYGRRKGLDSAAMRGAVVRAAKLQRERYRGKDFSFNSSLGAKEISVYCPLTGEGERLLENAYQKLELSARSYHKVIKVARTIADLEGEEVIGEGHISEALCYRAGERKGV